MDWSGCCEPDANVDAPPDPWPGGEPTSDAASCESESDSVPDNAPGETLDFCHHLSACQDAKKVAELTFGFACTESFLCISWGEGGGNAFTVVVVIVENWN